MSKQLLSYEILVAHFFDACDNSFAFLCAEHGFEKYAGMVEFRGGRKIIKPMKASQTDDLRLAICRLEHGNIALEITYSEDNLSIDSYIYYGFINRFSVSDILNAAKKRAARLNEHYGFTTPERIQDQMQDIARCIQIYPELFTTHNDKLIERAIKIRSKRMEQTVREQYGRNMDRAIERAAKAFRAKDYRKVVELYKPFEKSLKASDRKKYTRAINHLTDAHST